MSMTLTFVSEVISGSYSAANTEVEISTKLETNNKFEDDSSLQLIGVSIYLRNKNIIIFPNFLYELTPFSPTVTGPQLPE